MEENLPILKRSDLVAKYVGQTPEKTKELLVVYKDKTIFIDEFYETDKSKETFSSECIEEVNRFIKENPNIYSRNVIRYN